MKSGLSTLRAALGEAKRRSLRFRPGTRRDIALFGQRRGGSTLLAEGIAQEPGVFLVNEPFATWPGHDSFADRKRALLPPRHHGQLFDLDPAEETQVHAYVDGLRQGIYRFGGAPRLRVAGVVDRVLLKILNAPALIDWFAKDMGFDTVLLCRHPAAQALSVLQQGWGFSAEAYFASDAWCERHLTGSQIDLGHAILAGSDGWRKAILNWVIEAQVPFRLAPPGVLVLTYETLVLRPRETFAIVAARFDLSETGRFARVASRPSASSRLSSDQTRRRIEAGDRAYLLHRWQDQLDREAKESAQHILDAFEVTLYHMHSPWPAGESEGGAER